MTNLKQIHPNVFLILLMILVVLVASGFKGFPSKSVQKEAIIITKSCELLLKKNDTVMIEAIYHTCMEYSDLSTVESDSCSNKLSMELKLDESKISTEIVRSVYKMYGCNVSRKMVLKGVLKKEKLGYGHLGVKKYEFAATVILSMDSIVYSKIEE